MTSSIRNEEVGSHTCLTSPGDVHTSSLEVQQSHVSSALWLVDIPTSTCETHVYQRLGYLIIKPIINLIWPRLLCISETLQSKKVALHLTSVAGVFIFLDKTFLFFSMHRGSWWSWASCASTANRWQHSWHVTIKFLTFYRPKWNLLLQDFTPQKKEFGGSSVWQNFGMPAPVIPFQTFKVFSS